MEGSGEVDVVSLVTGCVLQSRVDCLSLPVVTIAHCPITGSCLTFTLGGVVYGFYVWALLLQAS